MNIHYMHTEIKNAQKVCWMFFVKFYIMVMYIFHCNVNWYITVNRLIKYNHYNSAYSKYSIKFVLFSKHLSHII